MQPCSQKVMMAAPAMEASQDTQAPTDTWKTHIV